MAIEPMGEEWVTTFEVTGEWTPCEAGVRSRTDVREQTRVLVESCQMPVTDYVYGIGAGGHLYPEAHRLFHSKDYGPGDRFELSKLQAAIDAAQPWNVFEDAIGNISKSRNGVRVTSACLFPVWGPLNRLYEPIPTLKDGEVWMNYPENETDFSLIMSVSMPRAHTRPGKRGEHVTTPFTTWHGHPTIARADETVPYSPRSPMWMGVEFDGQLVFAFRDGSISHPFKLPDANAATDFTPFDGGPGSRNFIYFVDCLNRRVREVNRVTPSDPSTWTTRTFVDGFEKPIAICQSGTELYVTDNGDGHIYKIHTTGSKVRVTTTPIPGLFWISPMSDGRLVITTLQHRVYKFDPARPDLPLFDLMNGHPDNVAPKPSGFIVSERWAATAFTGAFIPGEAITAAGLDAATFSGKFLATDGSTLIDIGITIGSTNLISTLTGSVSGATCMATFKQDSSKVWNDSQNPQPALKSSPWVGCSVDQYGTWGPVNEFTVYSQVHGNNVSVWRYQDGVMKFRPVQFGYGECSQGLTKYCHEELHYPWGCEHHPREAAMLTFGSANVGMALVAAKPANYPTEDYYESNLTLHRRAMDILKYGTVAGVPYHVGGVGSDGMTYKGRPSLTSQMTIGGNSGIGCTSDYIAAMTLPEQQAFIQGGFFSSVPRPEIKGQDLYAMMFLINRSSMRFLKQGKVLMDAVKAYCQPMFGQELLPLATQPYAGQPATTNVMDIQVKNGVLTLLGMKYTSGTGYASFVPPTGCVVRVVADKGLPEEEVLGEITYPQTLPLPNWNKPRSLWPVVVSGADPFVYRCRASVA